MQIAKQKFWNQQYEWSEQVMDGVATLQSEKFTFSKYRATVLLYFISSWLIANMHNI